MVTDTDLARLEWRKSSYSGGGNDCVEVAFTGDGAAVRDSKNPGGGALRLSRREWDGLLAAARAGRLDPR
ncbi:DUF397 domain-containing protein [Saccharomonospora piscinae]|uniref:DUF397 domain-containing protein n=1 Tax=Saccharomonospora piscinae TaxID=687388 RepID=A0A1V9AA93_SACPI|nr:DUF397 domain-containing protein [Saccharomonospora piscinae]OQO94042.1 DUF397 domain-containing protein [Saccharomonospora piscinae]TLW95215.1 DUF397 domain-containing protein [Saccharomonospora piscinae]